MMSFTSFETPCITISAAPMGMHSFTGQYWMPHSANEVSEFFTESQANFQPVTSIVMVKMKKNTD